MTLKELQKILTSIAPADREAMDRAKKRQAELAKPPGSLGKLEDMSIRLAGITARCAISWKAVASWSSQRTTASLQRASLHHRNP